MKLDLREYITGDDLAEHFEKFKEQYAYDEYMSEQGYMLHTSFESELDWFQENAPYFLPVLDKWVLNHVR